MGRIVATQSLDVRAGPFLSSLTSLRHVRSGCQYATFFSRTRTRLRSAKLQASNALPQNLTEPALGNDIAAVLLPPQHDFEFAHSEGKIENPDGVPRGKPV